MDFDHVRFTLPIRVPQMFAKHFPRHHLAGVPHQEFEQAELGRRQFDFVARVADAAGRQIEGDATDFGCGRRTEILG